MSVSSSSSWIHFNSTIGEAEVLMQTKYSVSGRGKERSTLTLQRSMSTQRRRNPTLHAKNTVFLLRSRSTSILSHQPLGLMLTSQTQRRSVLTRNAMPRLSKLLQCQSGMLVLEANLKMEPGLVLMLYSSTTPRQGVMLVLASSSGMAFHSRMDLQSEPPQTRAPVPCHTAARGLVLIVSGDYMGFQLVQLLSMSHDKVKFALINSDLHLASSRTELR